MKAEMPEVFRLWQLCNDTNNLPLPGGVLDQPHILLMEFEACERVYSHFKSDVATRSIPNGD